MRKLFFLMAVFLLTVTVSAKNKNKKEDPSKVATVYLYGMSSSFNDSTVYITDIQLVDSAYLENKYILGGLKDYSDQLSTFFTNKGLERRTNVVFFKKNSAKAEKAYAKLNRRYTSPDVKLVKVGIDEFIFKAVRPTEVENDGSAPEKPKKGKKPKGAPDGKRPPMGPGGQGGPGGMGGPGGGMGGHGGGMGNMGGMGRM